MENNRVTHLGGYLQQQLSHVGGPSQWMVITVHTVPTTINPYHYSGKNYTVGRK